MTKQLTIWLAVWSYDALVYAGDCTVVGLLCQMFVNACPVNFYSHSDHLVHRVLHDVFCYVV